MGRRRLELTPEEKEERKKRWWGEQRNARRRERYQLDKQYHEKTIRQVRAGYRRTRTEIGLAVRWGDCLGNIQKLSEIGQMRQVRRGTGHGYLLLTFTIAETAEALSRNPQVLYRWVKSRLLLPPVLEAYNSRNRWQKVYSEDEVRAIIKGFSAHQKNSQYFRLHHRETSNRICQDLEQLRLRNDVNLE